MLAGCASIARLPPPAPQATLDLPPLGVPNGRFWIDGDPAPMEREVAAVLARRAAARSAISAGAAGATSYLALSGGGDNGAFGAGLLVGWTASGTRPEFDVVTGISAGALIAPFAFLGPDYDDELTELFTQLSPADVIIFGRLIGAVLFGEALADTSPLSRLIARYADERMMAAIAAEHAKGRLLLIGTTNLDLQRPVIWNIGALAASGQPEALPLFRQILLASASIPGAFPPVLISVENEGQRFQEMHVDGGASTQVFLYPASLDLRFRPRSGEPLRQRTAWVIRNGRMDVQGANTGRSIFSIARRSAETLLHFSGIGDINRIWLTTARDGVAFRLAVIGNDFNAPRAEPFDREFMRALFAYGEAQGRSGTAWFERPPGIRVLEPDATRER